MSKINDGGPAFPVTNDQLVAMDFPWTQGMTLRDYFATHANIKDNAGEWSLSATQALVGRPCPDFDKDPLGFLLWVADFQARWRYMQADAMLRAREAE